MRNTRASLIGAIAGASALAIPGCGATGSTSPTALLMPQIQLTLNPNGIAPLTALATFETNAPAQVRVAVAGTIEVSKLFEQLETQHSVPILGLYPDRTNTVTLTLIAADGQTLSQTLSLTTPPLPDFLPQIEIDAANPGAMEPGLNLITLLVTDGKGVVPYPMVFDSNGDVRWYLDLSQYQGLCGLPFERAKDGNFVFGCGDSIYEYSVLGALARQWSLSGYNFHHEIVELPSGNWLASVDKTGSTITTINGTIPSVEDHVIEVDRQTGKVVQEWDLRNVMDVSRNVDLYGGATGSTTTVSPTARRTTRSSSRAGYRGWSR